MLYGRPSFRRQLCPANGFCKQIHAYQPFHARLSSSEAAERAGDAKDGGRVDGDVSKPSVDWRAARRVVEGSTAEVLLHKGSGPKTLTPSQRHERSSASVPSSETRSDATAEWWAGEDNGSDQSTSRVHRFEHNNPATDSERPPAQPSPPTSSTDLSPRIQPSPLSHPSPLHLYRPEEIPTPTHWTPQSFTHYLRSLTLTRTARPQNRLKFHAHENTCTPSLRLLTSTYLNPALRSCRTPEAKQLVVRALVQCGQVRQLSRFLEGCQKQGEGFEIGDANFLLRCFARVRSGAGIRNGLAVMKRCRVRPDNESWRAVEESLGGLRWDPFGLRSRMVELEVELGGVESRSLAVAVRRMRLAPVVAEGTWSGWPSAEAVRLLCWDGQVLRAVELSLWGYRASGSPPPVELVDILLARLLKERRPNEAFGFVTTLLNRPLAPDSDLSSAQSNQSSQSGNAFIPSPKTYEQLFQIARICHLPNLARVIWRIACLEGKASAELSKRMMYGLLGSQKKNAMPNTVTALKNWRLFVCVVGVDEGLTKPSGNGGGGEGMALLEEFEQMRSQLPKPSKADQEGDMAEEGAEAKSRTRARARQQEEAGDKIPPEDETRQGQPAVEDEAHQPPEQLDPADALRKLHIRRLRYHAQQLVDYDLTAHLTLRRAVASPSPPSLAASPSTVVPPSSEPVYEPPSDLPIRVQGDEEGVEPLHELLRRAYEMDRKWLGEGKLADRGLRWQELRGACIPFPVVRRKVFRWDEVVEPVPTYSEQY